MPAQDLQGHSLVVVSRDVEPAQEDVGIAQVAVGSALGCLVPKLLGDGQALQQTQLSQDRDTPVPQESSGTPVLSHSSSPEV